MSDTGVSVLNAPDLTKQLLGMVDDVRMNREDVRAVRLRVDSIDQRVTGLAMGLQRLETGQEEIRQHAGKRDERIGEIKYDLRTGFERVTSHLLDLDGRVDDIRRNMDDGFDAIRAEMNDKFAAVDGRFASVDQRFESVDRRFDAVDQRFATVEERLEAIAEAVGARPAPSPADD